MLSYSGIYLKYSGVKTMFGRTLFSVGILFLGTSVTYAQQSQGTPDVASYRAALDQYCISCHNETLKTANLVLARDSVSLENISENPALWEKVLLKMKTRSMPPVGMPRPTEDFYISMAKYLEHDLAAFAKSSPNPGRTPASHRLNRTEYTNVIRDLLGVNIDGASLLPPDNSGGFDNLGSLLSVSNILTEKYMSVARDVSRLAIGDMEIGVNSQEYKVSPVKLQS